MGTHSWRTGDTRYAREYDARPACGSPLGGANGADGPAELGEHRGDVLEHDLFGGGNSLADAEEASCGLGDAAR